MFPGHISISASHSPSSLTVPPSDPSEVQARQKISPLNNEIAPITAAIRPSPLDAITQQKNELLEHLFDKVLSTLGALKLSYPPSLFLVYAHNNSAYGRAEADTAKYFINKLSQIHINLYSDQTPMGRPYLDASEDKKKHGKLEDILTSQFCLLPAQLIDEVAPVDKIVVCCSEVLGNYLKWPDYKNFYQALRTAYFTDQESYRTNSSQARAPAIREVVKTFSQRQASFHHVLTEIAFLQIRQEHLKDQHGIISVPLTPKSHASCLAHFIEETAVRIGDIPRFETQAQAGKVVYPNQSRHLVLFKLMERVLVNSDEATTFLNKFWSGYTLCLGQLNNGTLPSAFAFSRELDHIFDEIQKELNSQLVSTVQYARDHTGQLIGKLEKLIQTVTKNHEEQKQALYRRQIMLLCGGSVLILACLIEIFRKTNVSNRPSVSILGGSERLPASSYDLNNARHLRQAHLGKCIKTLEGDCSQSIGIDTIHDVLTHYIAPEGQEEVGAEEGFPLSIGIPLISQINEALSAYYQPRIAIERISGDSLSLEDCYINLAIVEGKGQREQEAKALGDRKVVVRRLESYERISEANLQAPIPLEDLFNERTLSNGNKGVPKKILIQGRAGIGKTTLCKKLVYTYEQQWKDYFEAMLWIPLRELRQYKNAYGLKDILRQKYFPNTETYADYIYAHKNHVLFVLDGLDEVATDIGQNNRMGNLLTELLSQTNVILTSRPSGVKSGVLPNLDLDLETIGFTQENVRTYVKKIEPKASFDILTFIERTPVVRELANIPVQLDALCYSWKKVQSSIAEGKTLTVTLLYQAMINNLWQKDGERLEKEQKGRLLTVRTLQSLSRTQIETQVVEAENTYLSYLGFQGLRDERIEFDISYLNCLTDTLNQERAHKGDLPFHLNDDLKQTSFLHTLDANIEERERTWHFLHLTFQEFFAAKWIVRHIEAYWAPIIKSNATLVLSEQDLTTFIQQHKYDPRYEIVWWMVAGLLKKGEELEKFFRVLSQPPRDLIGLHHQLLIMRCLQEARVRLRLETIAQLEQELGQWLDLEISNQKVFSSVLGRQQAFPEHLLLHRMSQVGASNKVYLLRILGDRPILSKDGTVALIDIFTEKDVDQSLRTEAMGVLGKQSASPEGIRALIDVLKDKDADKLLRYTAARALGDQSALSLEGMEAWVDVLEDNDTDQELRYMAERALGKQAVLPPERIKASIDLLKDKDADQELRSVGAWSLGNQPTLPPEGIRALIDVLTDKDTDQELVSVAEWALGEPSKLSPEKVRASIDLLKDKDADQELRSVVERILGDQETFPPEGIRALIDVLKNKNADQELRSLAAWALAWALGLTPPDRIRVWIDVLNDKDADQELRSVVERILSGQSALPAEGMKALIDVLKNKGADQELRSQAAWTLGDQLALPSEGGRALIHVFIDKDEDQKLRFAAGRALGTQSALSHEEIRALIDVLNDKDAEQLRRDDAAIALGNQSALPPEGMRALIDVLKNKDEDPWLRPQIAKALGKQSALPPEGMRALTDILTDKDANQWLRSEIAKALGDQSVLPPEEMRALIDVLKDQGANEDLKSAAARALNSHIHIIYSRIANLDILQIQAVYVHALLRLQQIAPLYIQDNQLHFYIANGLGQPIELSAEQSQKVTKAFIDVQAEGGITSVLLKSTEELVEIEQ